MHAAIHSSIQKWRGSTDQQRRNADHWIWESYGGGLRANWEAFTVTKLSEAEAKTIEGQWNELVSRHTEKILAPDSTEALARAAKNNIRDARPRTRRKVPKRPEDVKQDDGTVQVVEAKTTDLIAPDSPVLVAELPRASDRWNQANFSLETYQGFFGAKIGAQHRILLQHVESDGHLAPLETRPSVEVRSRNFRFELQAAAHLPYPANGRPVAVFIRQLTGIFLYRLVLPSHTADYAAVSNLCRMSGMARSDKCAAFRLHRLRLRSTGLTPRFGK